MPAFFTYVNKTRATGIFIIALASIAYQVLLTRIFSVTLYYHFAFAGISLAMLGLTIGAEKIYLTPARFSQERFEAEWSKSALGFSISSILLALWFLCAPLILSQVAIYLCLGISLLLFVIPFVYSGICITLILTQSASVGKLYAADLIGAACGCVAIILLLFVLDPVTILFLFAALTAYAAWIMACPNHALLARKAKVVMVLMLAAAFVQGTLYLSDREHIRLYWAKGSMQQSILFERWNAFSRVRVGPAEDKKPFGWGFGHQPPGEIEYKKLDIDADAGTVITYFNGDLKPLAFLADDIINMAYHLRPVESVAVIGVGGGRDIMSALYFGAKKIWGIELNPAIVEALTKKFADFTGHFTELPGVTLINAEARSWLTQHHPQVDLVQISLIDTWAATAAGGLTLSENRLYTLEAWKEFLGLMSPHGMLEVSRWFNSDSYKGEFYRLLSLAAESLEAQGVPHSEVRQHILAFYQSRIITVVLSPAAFSPAEVEHARKTAKDLGFSVAISPDFALDETSRVIASGEATQKFYDGLPMDATAPTDDRPFFFYMLRFKDVFQKRSSLGVAITNNVALTVLATLLLGTLLISAAFILDPLLKTYKRLPMKGVLADLAYFSGIGLGFMLIEISQMQRLIVFLGHPVYGLGVVLFTLLLFSGIGSATVRDDTLSHDIWKRPLLLCLVLCAVGLLTPFITGMLVSEGTLIRIIASVMLLAPAGLCMGMMFPTGMIMSAGHRQMQSWFWGINGAMSVFASILGMMISIEAGITAAYWAGVAVYAMCLGLAIIRSCQPEKTALAPAAGV